MEFNPADRTSGPTPGWMKEFEILVKSGVKTSGGV